MGGLLESQTGIRGLGGNGNVCSRREGRSRKGNVCEKTKMRYDAQGRLATKNHGTSHPGNRKYGTHATILDPGRIDERFLIATGNWIRVYVRQIRKTLPADGKSIHARLNARPGDPYHSLTTRRLAVNIDSGVSKICLFQERNFNFGMLYLVVRVDTMGGESGDIKIVALERNEIKRVEGYITAIRKIPLV